MMAIEEYIRPRSVAEAVKHLRDADAQALAGGTELLSRRTLLPRTVVDLQDLPLNYVREDSDGLHLGATTSLETLRQHPLAAQAVGGSLARCALLAATHTERQSATLGGTLAAPGWNEVTLVLIAADAWVRMAWSGGFEVLPIDLLVRDRQAWLDLGTLITEVIIPPQPAGARFGFQRVSRTPRDRPIVAAAARLARDDSGCICAARLAVGGLQPDILRLEGAERDADGRALSDIEIAQVANSAVRVISAAGNWLASAEYRRAMAAVTLRRALIEARDRM